MIGFVDTTPEDASDILSTIQEADSLTNDCEAFVRALQNQDMWTRRPDALRAWYTFLEGGKRKLPEEVVNYHAIITGVPAR